MQPTFEDPVAALRATANRANAQRSTGPRTELGKQRSSQNAVRHGLTSRSPVLRSEDPAAYKRHSQEFHDEYQPQTPTERQLVQELADTAWRLNRIPLLEAQLLDTAAGDFRFRRRVSGISEATRALATLGLHAQRLSRQFNKTLATLRDLQAERRASKDRASNQSAARPAPLDNKSDAAPIGFVFSSAAAGSNSHLDTALNQAANTATAPCLSTPNPALSAAS
ncbi:MAG TPA: hypothetical protein VKX49_19510 [Bryobacteraceae bacterium]|nr:hypothetical protein [Bryobacteraceae bacterium]